MQISNLHEVVKMIIGSYVDAKFKWSIISIIIHKKGKDRFPHAMACFCSYKIVYFKRLILLASEVRTFAD